MRHYLYSSTGNTVGIHNYIGHFEVDEDGYCTRYLEIQESGDALRYTEEKAADSHGMLPDQNWHDGELEMHKKEYGTLTPITAALFETIWRATRCINE